MFIEVVKADYLDGYKVKLLFNNGETKVVDADFAPEYLYEIGTTA